MYSQEVGEQVPRFYVNLWFLLYSCPFPTSVNIAPTLLNSLSRFKANNQILWTTYFCLKNICMLLLFFCTFVHDFWIFWRFTYIRRIDWTGPWQSQQPDESPWKLNLITYLKTLILFFFSASMSDFSDWNIYLDLCLVFVVLIRFDSNFWRQMALKR